MSGEQQAVFTSTSLSTTNPSPIAPPFFPSGMSADDQALMKQIDDMLLAVSSAESGASVPAAGGAAAAAADAAASKQEAPVDAKAGETPKEDAR